MTVFNVTRYSARVKLFSCYAEIWSCWILIEFQCCELPRLVFEKVKLFTPSKGVISILTPHIPFIIIIINPITPRVVWAPQMILQQVFSIFPCSPLPSGTCRTQGLSIPGCCLPTSSFVRLVFFPLSLCLARWFWPDLMNGKHDHNTAVCVSLRSSDLHVVQLPVGSWLGLPRW